MLGLGSSLAIGGAPSEWAVSDISGISKWFKYQTNVTLDGANISTWGDNFGSETLTKTEGSGVIPYNGGDLNFDANVSRMTLDATWVPTAFSVYVVFQVTAAAVYNEDMMDNGNHDFFRIKEPSVIRVKIGDSGSNDITITNAFSVDTWYVLGIEWNGSTLEIFQDSKYDTASGTGSDTDTFAGLRGLGARGSNPFDGQIRELVLVNNALSSSDRNNLMEYLITVKNL